MSIPFNAGAAITDKAGRATPVFIAFLQKLGFGPFERTTYTFAEITAMTPKLGVTVICTDSSVTTIGSVLAGGGASIVQAIGDGTDWRIL